MSRQVKVTHPVCAPVWAWDTDGMKQYLLCVFCSWHCLVLYTQVCDTELQDAPVKTPGTLILL